MRGELGNNTLGIEDGCGVEKAETVVVPPTDDGAKMTPRTRGRLFALFEERLSAEKEAQLVFAAEHGVVVASRSEITELQARALIKRLEMIPPLPDPDDALAEYAEGRLL